RRSPDTRLRSTGGWSAETRIDDWPESRGVGMTTHAPVQTEPLEHTLEALAQEHETLIELAKQHREALRKADSPAIIRIAELRNQTNQRIIALDQERARIVSEISKSF